MARVRRAGHDAAGHAQDVAQDARDRGASLAGAAGQQLSDAAASQKDTLADRLEHVAEAVHRSGEQLEGQDDFVARLVERGAAELGTLAEALRGNDLQGLIGKLGDLARTQPALFVGASMAAGFALARVGRIAAPAPQGPGSGLPGSAVQGGAAQCAGDRGAGDRGAHDNGVYRTDYAETAGAI